MSTQSITFKVVIAWWLRPYLYTLVVLCALLGTEPNMIASACGCRAPYTRC